MSTRFKFGWVTGLATVMATFVTVLGACDPESERDLGASPDARISIHAVQSGAPTREGLAYIEAVARVHAEADGTTDADAQGAALRRGLALPVPAGLAEAEVLRLELATRLGETLASRPEGVAVALDLLEPMLAPDRSLPLDRASARALVTLGDLAVEAGDDALAVGSYSRAIRVMSSLRKELER
jgi:hypothetical protein